MPRVQRQSRQWQSSELPLQAGVQLLFAIWLPMHTLEQAQSRAPEVEYVRAAKQVLQGAGFDIKHLEVDKKVFYCTSGL